jgi:NADH-quinone oxidoreductase subunit D
LNYGFTGPNLRAAGVDYDVRVHTPYSSYEDFDFTIPVGTTGDVMIVSWFEMKKCGRA